jgi:hypothetical protein
MPVPVGQNPLIAIALCLMLPTLFTLDRETGIHSLIQTTSGTKKLRRTKYCIALLLTSLVFLTCWPPEAWFICKAFDLSQWTALLVSIQAFSRYPGWLPIWLAVVGLWRYRYALAMITCAIVCKTGEMTGKYIPTVLISILITFVLINTLQ